MSVWHLKLLTKSSLGDQVSAQEAEAELDYESLIPPSFGSVEIKLKIKLKIKLEVS